MSHANVTEQVDLIQQQMVALTEGLKAQHHAELKSESESRKAEIAALLAKVTDSISKSEEAKDLAEKAELRIKQVEAVRPILEGKEDAGLGFAKKRSAEEVEADNLHRKLFVQYITRGSENMAQSEVDFMMARTKALSGVTDPSGGYVIVPQMDQAITRVIYETSAMRKYAQVKTISTDQYEKLQRVDLPAAVWTDRLAPPGTTSTPTYEKLIIRTNNVAAEPLMHQFAYDDSVVDLENELIMALAQIFELTENTAFVGGDGMGQPKGFLSYAAGSGYDSTLASTVANWGKIEQVPSLNASAITYDGMVDLITELKEPYRKGAVLAMNRQTLGDVRLLKNGAGDPLWAPGLANMPSTLFGYDIAVFADMPSVGSGALAIAFANFGFGYIVADRMGTRLLRDPYTQKPFIKYYTTKRVGGAVDNYEAIKLQVISAS